MDFKLQKKLKNLVMVILKCPYLNWHNKNTRELFTKMISLKLEGYQRKHFFGVMPIDQTDYIANHLLICKKEKNGDLIPISGVKSLPYDFCKVFRTDFTIELFLKKDNQLEHLHYVQNLIKESQESQRRISYYSSWTQSPSIRSDFELVQILKELFAAMTVLHHREEKTPDLLGLGLPKFKTDSFFYSWGFERAKLDKKELVNIPLRFLGGIDCVVMHLKHYSDYAKEMSNKYLNVWMNRVSVGKSFNPDTEQENIAA